MKTRKEFMKGEWFWFLLLVLPLTMFSFSMLHDFMEIQPALFLSITLWAILYAFVLDRGYRDYQIKELQKQIDELTADKTKK